MYVGESMSWKGKLNKIDDIRWEIPKDHKKGMKVPTRIYANSTLLNELKQDKTLNQGSNVATLGGIYKYSVVLPDGHQGYGFPIGGVAATDADEGVISPGGVGYDINCLPGDTEVLSSFGYRMSLEDVSAGDEVAVMNDCHARPTKVLMTQEREDEYLYNIITKSDYELQASADHPILTREGMVDTGNLSEGDEIAIHSFKGVQYEEPSDFEIVSKDSFIKSIVKELESRDLLPLSSRNDKLPYLLKIFGYLLGDGTVYDKNVIFYGDKEDLEDIKQDIDKLGYSARICEREREYNIEGKEFTGTETYLKVTARSLAKLLWEIGYPKGDKTEAEITVPEWIKKLPKWMNRLFLASFFGSEMSKPKTSNKYNFYMPEVKFSKKEKSSDDNPTFLSELQKLLEEFGIESTISISSQSDDKTIYRILIKGNTENILKLWQKIGYEYNRKRKRISTAAIVYLRLKQSVIQKREKIRKNIKEEYENATVDELVEKYRDSVNRRFVERSLWGETSKARPPKGFVGFNEFLENNTEGEIVYDEIKEIEKIEHDNKVHDFTVKNEHHNFVANGVVVSNCGVRLLRTDLEKTDAKPQIKNLVNRLFDNVPSGVGSKSSVKFSVSDLEDILDHGAEWIVEEGYGWDQDLDRLEESGRMENADSSRISSKAKGRGKSQVGSLGSGNHFLEVQYVDEIFMPDVAEKFGISHEGQLMCMIHTGSRGFGHQVCSDNLRKMEKAAKNYGIELPDKELVNVPIKSDEGQDYFKQMACAANFAWANRQMITHFTRNSFSQIFDEEAEDLGMEIVYDVAHNIAKFEEHKINGSREEVCVHRKGATRAFPPGHSEIPKKYRDVGQPVIIPGNMGTASYVLVGTEQGAEETFSSTAHGSGRRMSRGGAKSKFWGEDVKDDLWNEENIYVRATHGSVIAEEAPGAYKDVDEVVKVSDQAGIGSIVARLRPMGVAKG